MKKKLQLSLFFLSLVSGICIAQQRYVTTSGNSSNDGLSEATAWSLSHAVSTATAGMTIYVKAGNYGNLELIQSQNGIETAKIHFKGYTSTPNDISSFQGSTFSRTTPLDASTMPLISGNFDSNNRTSGTGITINGQYVIFENFQITKKETGILLNGSFSEIINIIGDTLGDFSGESGSGFDDYSGYGVRVSSPNCKVTNTLIRNTGAEGIHFRDNGNYGLTTWSEVYCNNTTNPNDYYLVNSGTHHNRFENCTVYRTSGLAHFGHGLLNKFEAHDNVFENCAVVGTNIESTFGSYNNLWDNIVLTGHWDGINNANNDGGAITFGKNVHDEELRNIRIDNYRLGMAFSGWNESAGVSMPNNASYDCTFKNIVISNVFYAFSGNEFQNNGWPTYGHTFYNLTIDSVTGRLFITNRPMNGWEFYDCIFNNVNGLKIHSSGYNYDLNANTIFSRINITGGGLSLSDLTPYNNSNLTAITPPFNDVASQDFSLTTNALDIGAAHAENTTDILGITRTIPFSLGAYEFQPVDTTPPSEPTSLTLVSKSETTIDVSWSASSDNIGVTGYILYLDNNPVTTTADLNYQYSGLTEDTIYELGVAAIDNAGNESTPATISVTTNASANANICASASPGGGFVPTSIIVSEHDGNIPCNIMDNNPATRWSAEGDGEWASFDLGSQKQFDQLQISFYFGDTRKTYFDLQVSNDGQTWTTINNQVFESSGNGLALEDFNFTIQNARYVRYLGHGNSQPNNDWNSITELRINKVSVAVTGITVTPETVTMEVGQTESLVYQIIPSNATNQGILWSSSDSSIATVDQNGTVTAVATGNTTVTVTTDDGGFTDGATISVNDNNCPDTLPNGDASVTIGNAVGDSHLDSTTGTQGNGNGTCGIELDNDDAGEAWAKLMIPIDLAANSIAAGDQLTISIDGRTGTGNARIEVNRDNTPNTALASNTFGTSWQTFSQTVTIPANTGTLDIWLFSNYGDSSVGGTAFYDNLVVQKIGGSCPDELPNGDASVTIGNAVGDSHLDSTIGTQGNGNGTCGIELDNDDAGEAWAKLMIPIDLAANGIAAGDQLTISIDGRTGTGNARIEVNRDNTPNTALASNTFGTSWQTFSQTVTIPANTGTLDIWLFSNYGDSSAGGTAFYDNLVVQKIGGASLKAFLNFQEVLTSERLQAISVFPNPGTNEVQVTLTPESGHTAYGLYSLNGTLVKKGAIGSGQQTLPISVYELEDGIYLLNLSSESGANTYLKVVKE